MVKCGQVIILPVKPDPEPKPKPEPEPKPKPETEVIAAQIMSTNHEKPQEILILLGSTVGSIGIATLYFNIGIRKSNLVPSTYPLSFKMVWGMCFFMAQINSLYCEWSEDNRV